MQTENERTGTELASLSQTMTLNQHSEELGYATTYYQIFRYLGIGTQVVIWLLRSAAAASSAPETTPSSSFCCAYLIAILEALGLSGQGGIGEVGGQCA